MLQLHFEMRKGSKVAFSGSHILPGRVLLVLVVGVETRLEKSDSSRDEMWTLRFTNVSRQSRTVVS